MCLLATTGIYEKIKDQIEDMENDRAVLWALAALAKNVNNTITSSDADVLVGKQIGDLIERVEITDAAMRSDFLQMKLNFYQTKAAIVESVENTKKKILEDVEYFKDRMLGSAMEAVEVSKEAHMDYVNNSRTLMDELCGGVGRILVTYAWIFFIGFQFLLLIGIFNYSKLNNHLKMTSL